MEVHKSPSGSEGSSPSLPGQPRVWCWWNNWRFAWSGIAVLLGLAAVLISWGGPNSFVAHAASRACGPDVVDTGGGCGPSGPVVLSPGEQAILNKKNALAQEYANVRAGKVSAATFQRDWQTFMQQYAAPYAGVAARLVVPLVSNESNSVDMIQQPQQTNYYRGPASAREALGVRGIWVSQSTLAGSSYLKTDQNGQTSWNPSVMVPTLNALAHTSFYVAVNGSGVGGGFSVDMWKNALSIDIDRGWAPVGNTVEYSGSNLHLNGHPTSMTIYHWIAFFGYSSSGASSSYADSIANTTFWSWAPNVPAYSSFSSSSMTTLLNGRGFVW